MLTWRLTPALSFAEIEADLMALKNRLTSQRTELKEFYIDNCCSWRQKLQKVFGEQLNVYLDIFHAVKRFGEKVPKRHPLRRVCMHEWRMVFRNPSDQGEKRNSPTPAPDVMEANLDSFFKRWEHSEYKGQKVLSAAALKEIKNIRVHIKKGCLSGIPPGRGTNRNENLHKDLNKIMSCSKYGVELAYSLLTVILFNHNERMGAVAEKRAERPVEYYSVNVQDTSERFGLKFLLVDNTAECSKEDTFRELKLTTCTYVQLYQRILHTPAPDSGHHRQQNSFIDDEVSHDDSFENDLCFEDTDVEDQQIPISTLKQILMRAVSWFFIHKSMGNVSESAHLHFSQIPFMISTISDLSNSLMFMEEEEKSSLERLDVLLKSWEFSRLEVPRDGNCLFHSVAHNLIFQLESGNADLRNILDELGIHTHQPLIEIASDLRRGVVKEWIGEHSSLYQLFMTEGQLLSQAEQFLQDGVYSMDIGDLAITALSNMLQSPIVLFTSKLNQPIHIQNPTYAPLRSSNPIYLAYLQSGSSHYDAVIYNNEDQTTDSLTNNYTCSCGRKSSKGNACSFSLNKYSCRCPCYNGKQPCSQFCKCKGCTNSFGTRPEVTVAKCGRKRKRVAHDNQAVLLKGKRTIKFMESVGEPVLTGGFSRMEFFVICSIAQNLMADNLDWKEAKDINPHDVLSIYNCLLDLVQTLRLDLALFKRTQKNIEKLLCSASFKWDIFHQKSMILN